MGLVRGDGDEPCETRNLLGTGQLALRERAGDDAPEPSQWTAFVGLQVGRASKTLRPTSAGRLSRHCLRISRLGREARSLQRLLLWRVVRGAGVS